MGACRISQWITDWVMEKYVEMTGNKTQSIYLNEGLRRLSVHSVMRTNIQQNNFLILQGQNQDNSIAVGK